MSALKNYFLHNEAEEEGGRRLSVFNAKDQMARRVEKKRGGVYDASHGAMFRKAFALAARN